MKTGKKISYYQHCALLICFWILKKSACEEGDTETLKVSVSFHHFQKIFGKYLTKNVLLSNWVRYCLWFCRHLKEATLSITVDKCKIQHINDDPIESFGFSQVEEDEPFFVKNLSLDSIDPKFSNIHIIYDLDTNDGFMGAELKGSLKKGEIENILSALIQVFLDDNIDYTEIRENISPNPKWHVDQVRMKIHTEMKYGENERLEDLFVVFPHIPSIKSTPVNYLSGLFYLYFRKAIEIKEFYPMSFSATYKVMLDVSKLIIQGINREIKHSPQPLGLTPINFPQTVPSQKKIDTQEILQPKTKEKRTDNDVSKGDIKITPGDSPIALICEKKTSISDKQKEQKVLDGIVLLYVLCESIWDNRKNLWKNFRSVGKEKFYRKNRKASYNKKTVGGYITSANKLLQEAKSLYEVHEGNNQIKLQKKEMSNGDENPKTRR